MPRLPTLASRLGTISMFATRTFRNRRLARRLFAAAMLLAIAPYQGFALADQGPGRTESDDSIQARLVEPRGWSLVQAVLETNGASKARSRQSGNEFRDFADQLLDSGQVCGDEIQQAQAIHRFVHARILRGKYETSGNDLAAALAGGPFNCVTSSVLFLALAADFDLKAQAVAVPGHVWCRVASPRGPFDVETTCRRWFELAAREPANVTAELKQFMAERDRRSTRARTLDQPALMAIFHYNQGVRLLKDGQYSAAVTANLRALELDPRCGPAYDNLLATINNWSLSLAVQGERELGLDLVEMGLALAGDYEPFRVNQRYLSRSQSVANRAHEISAKHVFSPRSNEIQGPVLTRPGL
jgi:hypothetical protein